MPPGFLGSRADLLVDTVLVFNVIAPLWAWLASRLVRRHGLDAGERSGAAFRARARRHQRQQIALVVLAFVALFALEGSIRLNGGSGSLVAGSPYAGTPLLAAVFVAHIGPAVLTYLVWAWLAIVSYRRREQALPGRFSRRHRRLGFAIIAGLVWTALSAIAVYYYGFVA